jgi:DNA-binding CsgD family transcriptional regulator
MRREQLLEYHRKSWHNTSDIDSITIEPHIENLRKADELVPPEPRFYLIVNLNSYRYEFLGKGQQLLSGYSNEEVQNRGVEFFTANIYPEDGEFVLRESYNKFSEIIASEPVEERKNIVLQTNYRLRHKDGHLIHLIEQMWVLKLDDKGGIHLLLSHIYQLPMMTPFKKNILIKKLLPNQTYQTLYTNISLEEKIDVQLSQREKEVVILLTEGYNSKQIADLLFISTNTVKTHRKNILRKLDVCSTNELITYAVTTGLV